MSEEAPIGGSRVLRMGDLKGVEAGGGVDGALRVHRAELRIAGLKGALRRLPVWEPRIFSERVERANVQMSK